LSNRVRATNNGCQLGPRNTWRARWGPYKGVTEPDSSGSCLFEATNKRCIGHLLDGGMLMPEPTCGIVPTCDSNRDSTYFSWYAPLSESSQHLLPWLDNGQMDRPNNDGDHHITTVD